MLPTKFDSFGQAVSEKKIFKNRPIRNKNCLWWPCLLMDRDKMSNLYKGPSIDASYQVSVNLAEGFQRRILKCEKLTVDRRRTPSDGKSSHCLWQGELKMCLRHTVKFCVKIEMTGDFTLKYSSIIFIWYKLT
jgi:hypothetical protein